jgi:hypothetical protein
MITLQREARDAPHRRLKEQKCLALGSTSIVVEVAKLHTGWLHLAEYYIPQDWVSTVVPQYSNNGSTNPAVKLRLKRPGICAANLLHRTVRLSQPYSDDGSRTSIFMTRLWDPSVWD